MTDLIQRPDAKTSENKDTKQPKVGDWFYVRVSQYSSAAKDDVEQEHLRCITHMGTNYAELTAPGGSSARIHFDEFEKRCKPEPNADKVIADNIEHWRKNTARLMGRVKELTTSLAITPQGELQPQQETQALVLQSSTTSMKDYKKALVRAKDKTLPKLFEEIKESNKEMALWMKAPLVPLEAQVEGLTTSLTLIKNRVFNVELYAGLVEEIEELREGEPAPSDERVHLMQRRHYMDEECLIAYEHGGMEFKNIGAFNKWMAREDNFKRILPFPRCLVAFRVRRERKDRGDLDFWIRIRLEKLDNYTFLYMRNGERLYMLSTGIDFGPKLFPDMDRNALTSGQVLWVKGAQSGAEYIKGIITDDEYEGYKDELKIAKAELAAVEKKREQEKWDIHKGQRSESEEERKLANERSSTLHRVEWAERSARDEVGDYTRFSPDSVYYDDMCEYVAARMQEHNRLILILQGLFDRSPVFHPHPSYKLWERDGYEQSLKLVLDESRALTDGEKPDFEAYRKKLNASIEVGSVTIGQDDYWMRKEAEKENARRDRSYRRDRYERELVRFRPDEDPGPGVFARVDKISRNKTKCTFNWERERSWMSKHRRPYWKPKLPDKMPRSIEVPVDELLHVDAYKPGDFKMFFNDPRTRADYLQWAPLLIEAEEFHAGNRKLDKAGSEHRVVTPTAKPIVPDEDDDD